MGIIKDGAVSGLLPEVTAFAVHYPGYPSSTSRALETLGGIDDIAQARSSRPSSLELRFRPEDPYSHPAFGELRSCTSLLLKISKTKTNGEQTSTSSEDFDKSQSNTQLESEVGRPTVSMVAEKCADESPAQVSADIVARISEAYHFDGMVDYQYVPAVHAEEARRKRHWAEVEPNFEKVSLIDIDQDSIMLLVPPFFTLKDIPENLVLRPSATLHAKQKLEGVVQHHWEMDIEPCLAINFDIKEIPKTVNWENHIPQGSAQWEMQMVVSKLFDERPIWPRRSVQERLVSDGLRVSHDLLKRLLFRAAYYFSKGPFGNFWIRKGYDPRKDSESRIYQRVEFRIPPQLRKSGDTVVSEELKHSWKEICEFRAFPSKSFSSLQLFELADDYIQQEIRGPVEQSTCTIQTGWFSKARFHCLKLQVSVRYLSIFPRMGAADILKAASNSFEKSKRLRVLTRDSRHEDREHQHISKETAGQSSKSLVIRSNDMESMCNDDNNNGEEENDHEVEYEEEEEEEEKEYDEFGLSNMGAGDIDFPLENGSYPVGENFPNNYLQEILGGLSFTKDNNETGDGFHEAEMSDGEYQIYEQDSEDEDDYGDNYGAL